jgi:hypothetical protein
MSWLQNNARTAIGRQPVDGADRFAGQFIDKGAAIL